MTESNTPKGNTRKIINFELRNGKDDDIVEALNIMITSEKTRSSVVRDALRHYLQQEKTTRLASSNFDK